MTTIMNQITCWLYDIKIDGTKWGEHLVSAKHLRLCKEYKDEIPIRFFELIFSLYHNRSDIYNLKKEQAFDFWQPYFATKLLKEKFDILCSDSNNKSELEASLTSDLLYFMKNCTYDIGESYFDSLDKITVCRICKIEVNK